MAGELWRACCTSRRMAEPSRRFGASSASGDALPSPSLLSTATAIAWPTLTSRTPSSRVLRRRSSGGRRTQSGKRRAVQLHVVRLRLPGQQCARHSCRQPCSRSYNRKHRRRRTHLLRRCRQSQSRAWSRLACLPSRQLLWTSSICCCRSCRSSLFCRRLHPHCRRRRRNHRRHPNRRFVLSQSSFSAVKLLPRKRQCRRRIQAEFRLSCPRTRASN
mmetsp:Transcript_43129/g.101080  ORF Transcript_43129/g.101080 Transcript_43129/m.101080 type:complete len:217 (-) Transcript_43129:1208-1858(-)